MRGDIDIIVTIILVNSLLIKIKVALNSAKTY